MSVSSPRKSTGSSSPASSTKMTNFFHKLRRKRDSIISTSSSASSHRKGFGRSGSVRSRRNDDSYVDTEDSADSDDAHESDATSISSSLLRSTSMTSMDKSVSTPDDVFDKTRLNEVLNENVTPADAENVWDGFNQSGFAIPRYVRNTRRGRQSPQVVKRMFLAQELNRNPSESPEAAEKGASEAHDDIMNNSKPKPVVSGKMNKEIFVMQFSKDGKYLAVAGRDSIIKVWKVISSPLARMESNAYKNEHPEEFVSSKANNPIYPYSEVFHQKPVRVFQGHANSVLSLDWSKNNFLISGSMDRTVKLWHVDRPDHLASFDHDDFVTAVAFHPNDDRFFVSGCLDNNARLWSILERDVAYTKHLGDDMLITAAAFTPDGVHCVFGGFNGRLFLLETDGLEIDRKFDIKQKSIVHLGHREGCKITSIKVFQGDDVNAESVAARWTYLITTNDSKIRLVNGENKKLVTKFKGVTNTSSIGACISDDMKYVLSGSEDHWVYLWVNDNYLLNNKVKKIVKDMIHEGKTQLNDLKVKHRKYYDLIHKNKLFRKLNLHQILEDDGIVSNVNSYYGSFHAHHSTVNSAIFAPQISKRHLEMSDDLTFELMRRTKLFAEVLETLGSPEAEKLHFEPSQDENDGMIIVTTDEYGLIRVYRHDPAYMMRTRLLEMYKAYKDKDSPTKCATLKSDLVKIQSSKQSKKTRSSSPSRDNIKAKLHSRMKQQDSSQSVPLSKSRSKKDARNSRYHSMSLSIVNTNDPGPTLDIGREVRTPSLENLSDSLGPIKDTKDGLITPPGEYSSPNSKTVFPSLNTEQSTRSIPLIINTQHLDDDEEPQVLDFETPVDAVKGIHFDNVER